MIPDRTYKETENRNPNVYLGIDGSDIPFSLFKGVYLEHGLVFTDDVMCGVQFIVNKDKECVNLVNPNENAYVTLDDIQNDKWEIVMRPTQEPNDPWTINIGKDFFIRMRARDKVYSMYKTGKQGLLEYFEKVYDDEDVYYMKFGAKFNTRRRKGSTLLQEVQAHFNFIQTGRLDIGNSVYFFNSKRYLWDKLVEETKKEKDKMEFDKAERIRKGENHYFRYGDYTIEFIEEIVDGESKIVGIRNEGRYGTLTFVENKTNYFYITRENE